MMLSSHDGTAWFIDETKARGYHVVATMVRPEDAEHVRKSMRALVRSGQRRLHFKAESPASRRKLMAEIRRLPVAALVYSVHGEKDATARRMCLQALIEDAQTHHVRAVSLERDESLMAADRRILRDALDRIDYRESLRYEHLSPYEEPLLWISDAVAWCVQAGTTWRAAASPLITKSRQLR
ncbi:hypothetical protein [Microbacterium indicum]|uniref:hypothetical protein n=1 Tax=Microbacterium indicum TaxID=358100 RepID=UPI0012EB0BD7|nr:hypothetical protein [Microbacterium indicum]